MTCCELGAALYEERLLCETPNFFVIPTLGSLGIEGYLLIVSKEHYLGFGMIPPKDRSEMNELINDVKKVISEAYKKPSLIFEHGPRLGETESGKSIDHAHLHVVPGIDITNDWAIDMMGRLGNKGHFYRVERVEGFEKARELCETNRSYLYVENLEGTQLLSEQNFHRPLQYFRKMVASHTKSSNWNWKKYRDEKTLEKTVLHLRNKF